MRGTFHARARCSPGAPPAARRLKRRPCTIKIAWRVPLSGEQLMPSSREFKAVFFDLDGTLVDIHGPLYAAVCSALDQLGHAPPLTRERYHLALERDDPYLGLPEDKRAEYSKLAFAYFLAEIDRTERLEILPYVQET